jgi:hypothetical protein
MSSYGPILTRRSAAVESGYEGERKTYTRSVPVLTQLGHEPVAFAAMHGTDLL